MEVDSRPAAPFRILPDGLPSRTILNPLRANVPPTDEPNSPTLEIPILPKNAYGLESFGDYCAAVQRVKDGLPAIEAVTPPDRSEPLLIHGIQFKYWNPDQPESDASETESETTVLHTDELEVDRRKSTWSAGTPRKSILRQSISSVVREADLPHPSVGQTPLVYDYASTASPGSRCTSRLSSRRISIDAGVQSEHTDVQNNDEDVVRTAAKKRASARRSSIVPVKKGSFVQGLAGFTGIGRAESGAVICVANGKKFELVVDKHDRNDEREVAVQCSALEIDSEIEALFGECLKEEVIDVDSLPENIPTGKQKTSEESPTEDEEKDDTYPQRNDRETIGVQDVVPSPEQLRSARGMTSPRTNNIPDFSDIADTSMKDIDKTVSDVITPTHLSLKSDAKDKTSEDDTKDEVVAISAHGSNRLSTQPAAPEPVDVSPTPQDADVQPAGTLAEEEPDTDTPAPAPEAQKSEATPGQTNIHCIADATKTPPQATALAIARQGSLSLKPSSELAAVTQERSRIATEGQSLCLRSVPGLDIRPTASAYQLAAMATLSPKSYLRAIQPPSQPRVVFAFASPGGTAPIRGVDVAPPTLLSTPPVATLAVAPSSSARASLIAAPRRSHVSIPRTDLSTPSQGLVPINELHSGPRDNTTSAQVNLESEALVTPAPLQGNALTSEPRPTNSERTHTVTQEQKNDNGQRKVNMDESMVPSDTGLPEDTEVHPVDFIDDDDDDYGAPLDMDDDVLMEPGDLDSEKETAGKTELVGIESEQEAQNVLEAQPESVKPRSRKTSVASSRTRASRRTQQSSASERKRSSSVTQVIQRPHEMPNDVDFAIQDDEKPDAVEGEREFAEEEAPKRKRSRKDKSTKQSRKGGQKTTKRTGQKRWRELKSLPTNQVNANEDSTDGALRRSKRQRFPRLKFWRNETVSYERRLSQAIPTIAEVIVEVGASESDDDTWFGRR